MRPAGILCKDAMQFKSHITFRYRDNIANAKSVLSVLGACIKSGDEIELMCEGEDEEEALKAIVEAIEDGSCFESSFLYEKAFDCYRIILEPEEAGGKKDE